MEEIQTINIDNLDSNKNQSIKIDDGSKNNTIGIELLMNEKKKEKANLTLPNLILI